MVVIVHQVVTLRVDLYSTYSTYMVWFMVLNTTFNNISVISWRSVLLVEGTGAPRENHRPVAGH
jgi:hypothetical protein